ncbi:MAG: nitrophenyl compound nitroreductase subunit ArsF family protein [Planctomycetaceae bacterium]|nr:nitrophenyl compound nitroreductase subunit ArsF family protein [Planctomycetaceae bacterium]
MTNAKSIIAKVLLAFLLVSIGVAIGREIAARNAPASTGHAETAGPSKVIVYYMHGIPCVTCTFIDTTAANIVRNDFADLVRAGQMQFVSLNYLEAENAALADKFKVGENMVIAVRMEDGKEVARARLDKVMELAGQEDGLKAYLREGIGSVVKGGGR